MNAKSSYQSTSEKADRPFRLDQCRHELFFDRVGSLSCH
ncbi:Uncharacterised protein [Vibrio cholerae]|nr:Uncharacterised protein [Vibrio cholerae]